MNRCAFFCSFLLIVLLTGCTGSTVQGTDDKDKSIKELTAEVESLKADVESLKFHNEIQDFEEVAYLTPGEKGYSTIKTDLGTITVSLDDIQPYASGSKVKLLFGNTTSATLADPKATLDWGSLNPKGGPNNAGQKTKEVDFLKPFYPGTWTSVEVILDGVQPTALGFVRVHHLKNERIRLR